MLKSQEIARQKSGIRGILFDAGGTLIEPRYPIGEIYATFAAEFDHHVEPDRLQESFHRLFPLQRGLAFAPGLPPEKLRTMEMDWWRGLVREVFADQGPFPAFEPFFTKLYDAFESAELWRVVDGVLPTLALLKARGFVLGVASNFDSRLFAILRKTGLSGYFNAVKISSMCEAAKPAPQLFQLLLDELGLDPEHSIHVGDSWREDIEGALGAGMAAVLLDRQHRFIDNPSLSDKLVMRIDRFDQLTEIDLLQDALSERN